MLLAALLVPTVHAAPSELDEALTWLDSLDLPRPADIPFVRVDVGRYGEPSLVRRGVKPPAQCTSWDSFIYYHGLLSAEDKESFTIFSRIFANVDSRSAWARASRMGRVPVISTPILPGKSTTGCGYEAPRISGCEHRKTGCSD